LLFLPIKGNIFFFLKGTFAFNTTKICFNLIPNYQNTIPNKHSCTHVSRPSTNSSTINRREMVNILFNTPNMKTILIICILFASLLFSPSSILARELAESTGESYQPYIIFYFSLFASFYIHHSCPSACHADVYIRNCALIYSNYNFKMNFCKVVFHCEKLFFIHVFTRQ